MLGTEFYWTVVAALGGGCWAVISSIRERKAQSIEQSRAIMDRLLDSNKTVIENPEIQMYLSANASKGVAYFRDPKVLADSNFFKAKSHLYSELNLFDEILSIARHNDAALFLLKAPGIVEIQDWREFMKVKMSHPLCQGILDNEGHIFGHALRDFWCEHQCEIKKKTPDAFIW